MKIVMIALLAALTAAGSVIAATDTLTITSHRVINVCSGEQRWLVSAYIGEVYESDSLMSFDITIGYDTSLLVPTDGLFTGTLAEQMKFADISPAANFRVPGEMRVSGFTITRNVKGNLPLFAVAGTFKGVCGQSDSLTLPWSPEYNEEFKKWTKVFNSAWVESVAIPVPAAAEGIVEQTDSVKITSADTAVNVLASVLIPSNYGKQATATFAFKNNTAGRFAKCQVSNTTATINVSPDSSTVSIEFIANKTTDTVALEVVAKSATGMSTDTIVSTIQIHDTCTCSVPTSRGTTVVNLDSQPTAINMVLNEESPTTISVMTDRIEVETVHGGPHQVRIFTIYGSIIAEYDIDDNQRVTIPTEEMTCGTYLVSIVSTRNHTTRIFQR